MNETLSQDWWFILLGYIAFFVYSTTIMVFGVIIEKKTKIDKLVCRKLTHIISAFVWVICWFFFRCSIHWVIANGIGAIALAFVTFGKGFAAYERDDAKKSYGLFYFGFITFVVALICYLVYEFADVTLGMQLYFAAGIAYYCLSLGDGLAPIIAGAFRKRNPMLLPSRSLIGTISVFVFSLISTVIFSAIFQLQLSFVFMLSIAALTCIVEFYGIKGLDNILIDLCVFGYITLYYLGLVSPVFQIVVILSPVLASLAFLSKTLSFTGGVSTLILFFLIGYFSNGQALPILFIALMFVLASATSVFSKKMKPSNEEKEKSDHARTGSQVLAVGSVAVVGLILYYWTKETVFCLLYYVCIAEQFADSISSDIGYLTKGRTMDILRWKPIPKGISGGVSLLGTILALLASFSLLLVPLFSKNVEMDVTCYIAASVIAFLGTLLDSVLGSMLQARYRCSHCGALIETDRHCGESTVLVKGFRAIKNVTVNFITGIGCFLLGLLLIFVI